MQSICQWLASIGESRPGEPPLGPRLGVVRACPAMRQWVQPQCVQHPHNPALALPLQEPARQSHGAPRLARAGVQHALLWWVAVAATRQRAHHRWSRHHVEASLVVGHSSASPCHCPQSAITGGTTGTLHVRWTEHPWTWTRCALPRSQQGQASTSAHALEHTWCPPPFCARPADGCLVARQARGHRGGAAPDHGQRPRLLTSTLLDWHVPWGGWLALAWGVRHCGFGARMGAQPVIVHRAALL